MNINLPGTLTARFLPDTNQGPHWEPVDSGTIIIEFGRHQVLSLRVESDAAQFIDEHNFHGSAVQAEDALNEYVAGLLTKIFTNALSQ